MIESPSLTKIFFCIIKRQFSIYFKCMPDILSHIAFFVMMIFCICITIGNITNNTICAVSFTACILSMTLGAELMIKKDYESGMLEQLIISSRSTELLLFAKLLSHSAIYIVGFLLISPVICVLLNFPEVSQYFAFVFSVIAISFIANVVLMFTSAIGILTKNTSIVGLMSVPMLIPSVIFSTMSIDDTSYMYVLIAMMLFMIPLFLIPTAFVIRAIS